MITSANAIPVDESFALISAGQLQQKHGREKFPEQNPSPVLENCFVQKLIASSPHLDGHWHHCWASVCRRKASNPVKKLLSCLSGQQLHEEQDSHVKPDLSSQFGSRYAKQEYYEISFGAQAAPADIPDIFHGFLAIGTLGSSEALVITDPPTPTFAVSLDDITEKNTNEVTPDDLKLINEELEKFIEAESEEEGYNGTSRNSCVSAITLYEAPVCPLQGYLFGSTVELPEMRVEKKNKKVSLGQLFEETKQEEKVHMEKSESRDTQLKATGRYSKRVKKVLKKLTPSSSRGSDDGSFGADGDNPASGTLKHSVLLQVTSLFLICCMQVLQMFHRKIHPDKSETPKEWKGKISQRNRKKNTDLCSNKNPQGQDYDRNFPHRPKPKTISPHPHFISNCLDESEGHWIKTDADCEYQIRVPS